MSSAGEEIMRWISVLFIFALAAGLVLISSEATAQFQFPGGKKGRGEKGGFPFGSGYQPGGGFPSGGGFQPGSGFPSGEWKGKKGKGGDRGAWGSGFPSSGGSPSGGGYQPGNFGSGPPGSFGGGTPGSFGGPSTAWNGPTSFPTPPGAGPTAMTSSPDGRGGPPTGLGSPASGFRGGPPGGFGAGPNGLGSGGPPGGFAGGPPGGFAGGPPGGMMRGMDPERLWEVLKQQTGSSEDTIDLSKLPESVRRMNRMMAERFGTEPLPESGMMTKEQFISFSQRNMQRMSGGMGMAGPGGGGFGGGPPPWGERNGERRERDVSGERGSGWGGFGGGPPPWAAGSSAWGSNNPNNPQDPRNRNRDGRSTPEEPKPVALRYGKLPSGLPDWFESDDINKDGQVSLYEWIKAGKSMEEFLEMDLNRDGLLTADELLRYRRLKDEEARITAIMEGTPPSVAGGGSFGGGRGGRPPSGGFRPGAVSPQEPARTVRLPGSSPEDSSSSNNSSRNGSNERNERTSGRPNPFQNGGRR